MTCHVLEEARKRRGVSQLEAAKLLGLSQPMLSHLETGRRNVSADVARKAVELFGADPTVLPLSVKEGHREQELATELASLGYPGFAHLKGLLRNPAEVLFDALDRSDLDVRVTEGLPWLILHYANLDWTWLVQRIEATQSPKPSRLCRVTCRTHGRVTGFPRCTTAPQTGST